MSEELDKAAQAFTTEIAPDTRPRDIAGRFVETPRHPVALFEQRETEGAEDAGDNENLRAKEREIRRADTREADDWNVHRTKPESPSRIGDRELEPAEGEPELTDEERAVAEDDTREVAERRPSDSEDEKYEVIVDGQPQEVSLGEALNGYVRQETFHRRLGELQQWRIGLEEDSRRQQENWQLLMRAKEAYENDVRMMMPPEPDWDREFAINPVQAHQQQKIFQSLYAKLAQSQNERAQMAAIVAQESDRQLQKYAVDGFSRFVMESKIPDEPALRKEIQSMRKTAFAAGFSEQEVATVYDPRMLSILRKASKYDRMMAATRPRAADPSRGKTLAPGAATPIGNAPRKGLDDAQRRLASSGRLEDAADVFRRLL